MNPYIELGLPTDCTIEDVKNKFRVLAQQHHPDKGGSEEHFKRIKLAYEILIDPVRKNEYDTTGSIEQNVSIRSEALQEVASLLLFCINNLNPEVEDLILKMKVEINGNISKTNSDIEHCNNYVRKLEIVLN